MGCQFKYQNLCFDDQRILYHFMIKNTGLVCSVVPVSVDMGTGLVLDIL